jgi:hypothetical protein
MQVKFKKKKLLNKKIEFKEKGFKITNFKIFKLNIYKFKLFNCNNNISFFLLSFKKNCFNQKLKNFQDASYFRTHWLFGTQWNRVRRQQPHQARRFIRFAAHQCRIHIHQSGAESAPAREPSPMRRISPPTRHSQPQHFHNRRHQEPTHRPANIRRTQIAQQHQI